jgi:hypothetical protein
MEKKGIKDMMEKLRYRASHLQTSLLESEIPGNWEDKSGLQNVYNLIEGRVMPKDGYVFIFLSEFLQVNLREVLLRYTKKKMEETTHEGNQINW